MIEVSSSNQPATCDAPEQTSIPRADRPARKFTPLPRSTSMPAPGPQSSLIRFAVLNVLRHASMMRVLILLSVLLQNSNAAPVTFGFTGHLSIVTDVSNSVAGVKIGTPFTGIVTYDPALTKQPSDSQTPTYELYQFTNAPGLSFVLQVGGHTFTGAAKTLGKSGIYMYDNHEDLDQMSIWINPDQIAHNNTSIPTNFMHGGFVIRLNDNTETAFPSDALPTTRPVLNQFTSASMTMSISKAGVPELYYVSGGITELTDTFQPLLSVRRLANGNIQLVWPVAATGFALESRPHLTSSNWQPVVTTTTVIGQEYTVTLPANETMRHFRLTKTNP
jgi:hypothetical protein